MELDRIYKVILENMTEQVYVRDLDMNILYINPAAEKLTGWSLDEATGKKCYDIFGDEKQTCKNVCPVEKAISEKLDIHHHEGKLKTRSGEERDMKVSISPLRENDTMTGAIVVMEDITRLREIEKTNVKSMIALHKNETFLSDILESIQDGISVLDKNLIIQRVNGVLEKWYENNLPLVGKKCHVCYHGRSEPCDPCPTLRCLQSGKTEWDIVPGLPGSRVEWLELFSFPIKDKDSSEVTGVVEFARDITQRQRSEAERKKLIRELQETLDRVKTLSGLIPICSICKNIRDDEGYWNKIEAYVQRYSEAEFSHSICPDCAKEHYPDLDIYDD